MASAARRYFKRLSSQTFSDKTLESDQIPQLHWSARHVPPSLTQEPIRQEVGEPVKAVASATKNSSFGGYDRSVAVGLALAPIGRQRENIPAATPSAVSAGQERSAEAIGETVPAHDPEGLASEVYSILKRRLRVEKERITSVA